MQRYEKNLRYANFSGKKIPSGSDFSEGGFFFSEGDVVSRIFMAASCYGARYAEGGSNSSQHRRSEVPEELNQSGLVFLSHNFLNYSLA